MELALFSLQPSRPYRPFPSACVVAGEAIRAVASKAPPPMPRRPSSHPLPLQTIHQRMQMQSEIIAREQAVKYKAEADKVGAEIRVFFFFFS